MQSPARIPRHAITVGLERDWRTVRGDGGGTCLFFLFVFICFLEPRGYGGYHRERYIHLITVSAKETPAEDADRYLEGVV